MKKLCLSMIALAGISAAPLTFADNTVSGYYSSLQTQTVSPSSTLKATPSAIPSIATTMLMDTSTNILVTNSSRTVVNIEVPGSPIKDYQHTNTMDYIRNNGYDGLTYIVLKDPNGNQFWGGNVENHAVINVTGGPGTYNIDIRRYRG